MREPTTTADRLAAEALLDGIDGCDDLDLMPALCRRHHFDACRRAVWHRADALIARRKGLPHA